MQWLCWEWLKIISFWTKMRYTVSRRRCYSKRVFKQSRYDFLHANFKTLAVLPLLNIPREQSNEKQKHMLVQVFSTHIHSLAPYLSHSWGNHFAFKLSWWDESKQTLKEKQKKRINEIVCSPSVDENVCRNARGINFIRTLSNYDDLMQTTIFPKEEEGRRKTYF